MNVDQLNIVLRPRSPFEGLDLGFAAASRYFLTLWLLWLAAALPVIVASHALLLKSRILALLLLWWAKPLFEAPILCWLSKRIFNQEPSIRTIIRSLPAISLSRFFPRLTWRRFSPNRSFYAPVMLLEGMRGKDYADRAAVLGSNQTAGLALTFICFLFEILLLGSMLILVDLFVPDLFFETGFYGWLFQAEGFAGVLPLWLAILAMSAIAPFYVAAGFLLYLTRRTILEAWDIELKFKRLLRRRKGMKQIAAAILVLALNVAPSALFPPVALSSQIDKQSAKQRIDRILSSEDFGSHKTVNYWRLKQFDAELDDERHFPFQDVFSFLAQSLALMVKFSLWIAGGIILALFFYFLAKNIGISGTRREKPSPPPAELFGLPLSPESMPGDIAGEAARLLEAGRVRAALSLLYRGALFHMIHESLLEIPASATEGECICMVRKHRPEMEARYFHKLTNTWLGMAYGHIRPHHQTVAFLLSGWGEFYIAK
jgi:hypothetical protein